MLNQPEINVFKLDLSTLGSVEESNSIDLNLISFYTLFSGLNRLESMLLCERKLSYTQQSQRYVTVNKDGVRNMIVDCEDLPDMEMGWLLSLLDKSVELYYQMSTISKKVPSRPKADDYDYGIPIEDARYCLPLISPSNMAISGTGMDLVEIYDCLYSNNSLFSGVLDSLNSKIEPEILRAIENELIQRRGVVSGGVGFDFDLAIEKNNLVGSNSKVFWLGEPVESNSGMSALISTQSTEQLMEKIESVEPNELYAVAERVLGYGHTSIMEHNRVVFLKEMSLTAYHQYIRHRLPFTEREPLESLIADYDRDVVIPPTVENSSFKEMYVDLAKEMQLFRKHIKESGLPIKYAMLMLQNCNTVRVLSNSNLRMESDIMKDRLCHNAQWEIREMYTDKYNLLKEAYPELKKVALPSCCYGKCKEGGLSCGTPFLSKSVL